MQLNPLKNGTLISPGRLVIFCLCALTLITYWPVQNYDFVSIDDSDYVYENDHVSTGLTIGNIRWAFTAIHSSNWHPLTWISHMADAELFGLQAAAA